MAQKPKTLDDAEIVTRVLAKSKETVSWYDSRLSKERTRVLKYYNGELPARAHPGSSSYISTDVYDSVEMMKAQLLETFAGGDEIATFDPDTDMNAADCLVATKYASYIIFRQNNGYEIFNDVIHDGLTARVGVAKVFWEEKSDYREEEFEDLPPGDAMGLAAQPDVDEFDGTFDDQKGTYKGSLTRKIDASQVRILCLAPEEFLISPRAISIKAASYTGHRTLKTKAELIEMGYDKSKVEGLHYDDSKGLDLSPEVLERNKAVETAQALNDPIQPDVEQVMFYESFVRMRIDSSKGVRLYKICHVNDVLLDKQEVDKAPFLPYVPLPVPHLFYGNNFAARVIPIQNARTVLTRGVLDHTSITTNPRWQVVKGGLINPREMMENRLGGLVNVSRPDSVTPLLYPNLNPFVFQVLGMLKDDKEQSTGISSLSQGLNKDAVSKQNSQGLIDNLVSLSGQRQKIAARNFAYNFFVPLLLEVIRLAILHEKKEKFIEVAGDILRVNPAQWTERTTCSVSMHLGYGEKDQAVSKMTQAYEFMAKDPAIQPMFTVKNRYDMIRDTMKMAGLTGAARYITAPDKVQPPPPDPLKTQELAIKDKEATADLIDAQVKQKTAADNQQASGIKMHQDQQKIVLSALDHDRTHDRQDLETTSRINIANREMKMAEKTPPTNREAIVAP